MTLICAICMGDISSETSSALTCGHLLHKRCIESHIDADLNLPKKFSCPICKSYTLCRRMISQVYFTCNEDPSQSADQDIEEIFDLKDKIASLVNKRDAFERKASNAALLEEVWKEKSKKCEEQLQSLNYLKQLQRVNDLDRYMSLPTTQSYLDTLLRRPQYELMVAFDGVKSQRITLAKEKSWATHRLKVLKAQIKKEEATVENLEKESLDLTSRNSKNNPLSPTRSIKLKEPSKLQDVTVIDTDDDSDVEEIPYTEVAKIKQAAKSSSEQVSSGKDHPETFASKAGGKDKQVAPGNSLYHDNKRAASGSSNKACQKVESGYHSESSYSSDSDASQESSQLIKYEQAIEQSSSCKRPYEEENIASNNSANFMTTNKISTTAFQQRVPNMLWSDRLKPLNIKKRTIAEADTNSSEKAISSAMN
ncbi:hypothetical protein BY458DRAFT_568700 [Sporodiniella umbellata]|nr:hypothetical protein BY458DRAFT_568700 [Sporodiniella umbellata]